MADPGVRTLLSYETKDSGHRETYPSGMVRDTQDGKPRFDLMWPLGVPYEEQFLTRVAALLARGAVKYGDRNWEKGNSEEELNRALASAARHFAQWLSGEDDEDHGAAVVFNIMQAETLNWKLKAMELQTKINLLADRAGIFSGKSDPPVQTPREIDVNPAGW